MNALARSVIEAALFLELSGDDVVDPDSAVKAMESIAYELSHSSDAERIALREAVDELIDLERGVSPPRTPRPEVIEFLKSFMESVGLEGE